MASKKAPAKSAKAAKPVAGPSARAKAGPDSAGALRRRASSATLGAWASRPRSACRPVRCSMAVTSVKVAAKPKRKGINPFTKEEQWFAAKPASTKVKVRALKKLKDAAN